MMNIIRSYPKREKKGEAVATDESSKTSHSFQDLTKRPSPQKALSTSYENISEDAKKNRIYFLS